MDTLSEEYFKLDKNYNVLYIEPNIEKHPNKYLELLYKEIKNEKNITIASLSKYGYAKLFFRKLLGEKSILHHHWFEVHGIKNSVRISYNIFWIMLYRLINGKVVWTVHNIYPHNQKFLLLNKILRILLARTANKLHVHCKNAVDIMDEVLKVKKSKFFILEHPNYAVDIYPRTKAVDQFKLIFPHIDINFDKKTFLVFGEIARYKGIKELLDVIASIEGDFNLIIAGKIKAGNEDYAKRIMMDTNDSRIVIIDKYISDDDVNVLFGIADSVLFNHRLILTSGGVSLSLNYKKYTIAPNQGCIADIDDENLHTFDTQDMLKKEIISVLNQ